MVCRAAVVAVIVLGCFAQLDAPAAWSDTPDATRPNIVWILSEDNSKHYLQHFDPDGAPAPNIEAMAESGITFDRAFSNAPVCSVARTTLITGCYAPRIGTQYHRPLKLASLADNLKMFPEVLRAAGYHTSNRVKEDYNATESPDVWDESSKRASWKNRPDSSTPFFHVRTFTTTHESRLHFDEAAMQQATQTDPDSVSIQPYLPDTPLTRYTRAKYHDLITQVDQEVGTVIEELREAGELENTFVFYFGDHGGVLPRSKGYVFESGLHVPLVVRVPEQFQDQVDRPRGSRTNGFVEFVDFAPTVLNLAGIEISDAIDGQPFLGEGVDADEVDGRNETLGYADRMDGKYDLVRSLRVGDWKYIRYFEPMYPDALQNNYRFKMLAYQQWRRMHESGELDSIQDQFFVPHPNEALYDLSSDPHETVNLADESQHRGRLLEMRGRLTDRLRSMPDLSFATEIYLFEGLLSDPVGFGEQNAADIGRYIDTVNLGLQPLASVEPLLLSALEDADPLVRHWAIVAASSMGPEAESLLPVIERRLVDLEPFVVARAVEFCAMHQGKDPRPYLYRSLNRAITEPEAMWVLRSAIYLKDHTDGQYPLDMSRGKLQVLKVDAKSPVTRAVNHLNGISTD